MSGYSRQEVAQRAGVGPDYVDRLVELGILTPGAGDAFSPGDVLRARWVQSFEAAGVPLEGIAAAVRDGALSFSYLDAAAFDQFAGLSGTTFNQLSAQTGIPLELLLVVREAYGFAEPGPQDTVRRPALRAPRPGCPALGTGNGGRPWHAARSPGGRRWSQQGRPDRMELPAGRPGCRPTDARPGCGLLPG